MSGGYLEDASQEATAVVDLDCPLTQWTCPNIKIKQYKLAQRAYNALRALRFAVNCYQERTAALREQSARVRPQARRGAVAGLAREQLEQLNFTDILICRTSTVTALGAALPRAQSGTASCAGHAPALLRTQTLWPS